MAESLSPTPTTPKGGGSMSPLMTQSHDKPKRAKKTKAPKPPKK